MTCPVCNGIGYVRKRFLWVFTRSALCDKCLGSGEFPPKRVHRILDSRADDPYYRDHDHVATMPVATSEPRDRDSFSVGDGGRSGGGGGGASWDEGGGPLITDPFAAADAPGGESIAAADSASSDSGSAGDSSESSDTGTSY